MKNFNRNIKAISPIFATLILIAIAVIAGVVVYMFTSGTLATMTGGGTAAQEKVAVQGFQIHANTGIISVYAQSTNGLDVTVNSLIIKDQTGTTFGIYGNLTNALPKDGALTTITPIGVISGNSTALVAGNTYSVTITSAKGGSFVSSSGVAAT